MIMVYTTKTIELPEELYNSLQELKWVFSQLTGQPIEKDEDVIWILLSAFVDSVQGMEDEWWEEQEGKILTE